MTKSIRTRHDAFRPISREEAQALKDRFEEWVPFANSVCKDDNMGPVADFGGSYYRALCSLLDLYSTIEEDPQWSDEEDGHLCGASSPLQRRCKLPKGHKGDHMAVQFF